MARRMARTARTFRGARRRTPGTWARQLSIGNGIAASTKLFLSAFTLDNPGIGETIRRTVGLVNISSDQSAAVETPVAAFGMVVVSDAAAAIGVTALPGPITEASDDGWFVWQALVTTQGADTSRNNNIFNFDSRAMRRVEQGFQIALMIETGATFGSIIQVNLSLYATRS